MSASASHQSPVVLQRQQSARQQHHRQPSTSSRHTHTSSRGGDYPSGTPREPDAPRHSSSGPRPSQSRQMPDAHHHGSGAPQNGPGAHAQQDDQRNMQMQRTKKTTITGVSGTWHLGKTIGAGSMGKVKLAKKADGSEQVGVHR